MYPVGVWTGKIWFQVTYFVILLRQPLNELVWSDHSLDPTYRLSKQYKQTNCQFFRWVAGKFGSHLSYSMCICTYTSPSSPLVYIIILLVSRHQSFLLWILSKINMNNFGFRYKQVFPNGNEDRELDSKQVLLILELINNSLRLHWPSVFPPYAIVCWRL